MLRIGVKCEIHSCSLEFMKQLLKEFYDLTDNKMINDAFKSRIDLQYYADRHVDSLVIEKTKIQTGKTAIVCRLETSIF